MTQALTATIAVRLPPQATLAQTLVSGETSVSLGVRARVAGPAVSALGKVEGGVDSNTGSIVAATSVALGNRARVNGPVTAGGTLTRGKDVVITGPITTGQPIGAPTSHSWNVSTPSGSMGAIVVAQDQTRDLAPGSYGDLTLKPRAKVVLHGGVYSFAKVTIEPNAELLVDSAPGPVQLYATGAVSYKGTVRSATIGVPQLLIGALGSSEVSIQTAFTGVVVAPSATIRLKSGKPEGHLGAFFGKAVTADPDTVIRALAFDWGEIVGPAAEPPLPPNVTVHGMPASPTELVVGVGKDSSVLTATRTSPQPVPFKLWDKYSVDGGVIANGTVRFGFTTPEGVVVTCTYQGGSSTAAPADADELVKGQQLTFVSCTDGLPPDAPRRGTRFTLEVVPVPGYPVTVRSPTTEDTGCSDEMQLLSSEETRQMRRAFRWDQARPVAARNPDGFFALYHAWVYIRNKDEALALRKLLIHVLTRPLFNEELDRLAGKCGTLTNPGDGEGTFVPVVIPGAVYNKLIDALTSPDVKGDRVIFDAVIIRQVPAAARNANGSIRLDLLAQSGFRYLHYEPKPLIGFRNMQLEGGASKLITDALEWVATAAKDVGEFVTNRLGDLDRLFRGSVVFTLHMHALTEDPSFSLEPVMIRGWGPGAGRALGARGLQVSILQQLFDSPIPTTSMGNTNESGRVVIKAVANADSRRSGLCLELKSAGAMVTDFLIATELCDLRGLAAGGVPASFRLTDFSRDQLLQFQISNVRVMGMYQADDVAQWNRKVGGFGIKRARILSGYWATTFSSTNDDGTKRLYAPCLNFANSLSDTFLAASFAAGLLSTLIIPIPIIPTVTAVFTSILTNSDIVMSPRSNLPTSRLKMSHEYGHYTLCALLQASNPVAVSHIVWDTIAAGDDQSHPLRAMNEAFADYIAGQVTGGLDYGWSGNTFDGTFCSSAQQPCWDQNLSADASTADGAETIGRFATLVQDLFDGHNRRFELFPGDGDVWQPMPMPNHDKLELSLTGYGDVDAHLERVALPGSSLRAFGRHLAAGLADFGTGATIDHERVFSAANDTMADRNISWCDRCRVLALHSPPASNTVRALWDVCVNDALVRQAVGAPPEASRRLDADTCTVCPAGTTSDANGVCQPCNGQVHGNSCDVCGVDLVFDGATIPIGRNPVPTTTSGAGDLCPELLVVDVVNPQAVFGRGAVGLSGHVSIDPFDRPRCERHFDLVMEREAPGGGFVSDTVISSNGVWIQQGCNPGNPICLVLCNGLPRISLQPGQVTGSTLRFRTPAHPNNILFIDASRQVN